MSSRRPGEGRRHRTLGSSPPRPDRRWPVDAAPGVVGLVDPGADTVVELAFDASPANIRVARLVASCLMVERCCTVDAIEDVRIAVDELCALLVGHVAAHGALVELRFRAGPALISVEGRAGRGRGSGPAAAGSDGRGPAAGDQLTGAILDATVVDHRIEVEGPVMHVTFHKPLRRVSDHGDRRAAPATAGAGSRGRADLGGARQRRPPVLADHVGGELIVLPVRRPDGRPTRRHPEASQ